MRFEIQVFIKGDSEEFYLVSITYVSCSQLKSRLVGFISIQKNYEFAFGHIYFKSIQKKPQDNRYQFMVNIFRKHVHKYVCDRVLSLADKLILNKLKILRKSLI